MHAAQQDPTLLWTVHTEYYLKINIFHMQKKMTYAVKEFWQNLYVADDGCVWPKHVVNRYI
jgi:hypothetical protein